jgi:hypothetical protein
MLQELRKKDIKLSPQAVEIIQQALTFMVLFCFIVGIALVYWQLLPPRKDLYNELWGPAYLLVRGLSPYDTASLNPVLPAAWLPMSIGFFAPIGWLSENGALAFWFVFSLVELALIIYLVRGRDRSIGNLIVISVMSFGFPSAIHHLILGQFSMTTTLCVIGGVYLILKERHWMGAFLLALGLSKIHLMTLPMIGLSILYYQRSSILGMLKFWGRVFVACLTLCLPLFIAYPNWIPDAIKSMTSNAPWAFPTLQKYLVFNFGSVGMVIWGISVILTILISLFIWFRVDPISATFWNMGLALLVSPYIGSWDFVTLLPLLIHNFLPAGKWQKTFMVVSYLTAWVLMARIQLLTESHNHYFWWVPLWHLVTAALVTQWRKIQNVPSP